MTVTPGLLAPVEVDQSGRMAGGLLDVADPAPDGWQRGGLTVSFHGCHAPDMLDKCVSVQSDAPSPSTADFKAFVIAQGDVCSTLSRLDHATNARQRLEATTEWALGRQLSTDQAGLGTTSLADATLLGTCDNVTDAVSALEQAAADTGFGAYLTLHTSVRGASYLANASIIDLGGPATSPVGSPWVFSSGYANPDAGTVRFWATGRVWVGVGTDLYLHDPDWRTNTDEAFAERPAIVAFDPCINLCVDVTVGSCVTPPEPPPEPSEPTA